MRGWLFSLVMLAAPVAHAHDADVIYVELNPVDGGLLERATMTASTLGQIAPVDADGDGELTQADLDARKDAVEVGVWKQMPLSADGVPCRLSQPDTQIRSTYLELTAQWACGPGDLKQEYLWLRILPPNYRVVLGSQLDGEWNRSTASGNVQTLTLTRPKAPNQGVSWALSFTEWVALVGLFFATFATAPRGKAGVVVIAAGLAGAVLAFGLHQIAAPPLRVSVALHGFGLIAAGAFLFAKPPSQIWARAVILLGLVLTGLVSGTPLLIAAGAGSVLVAGLLSRLPAFHRRPALKVFAVLLVAVGGWTLTGLLGA